MNHGRRKERIFVKEEDYQRFINILQETIKLHSLRISAYCLMPTYYHLLIQTTNANLSRCMRHINGIYTQRFNRAYALDGQLFKGRYKAIVVAEDDYLLQLVRYIHRNPIRANLVSTVRKYKWSSHQGYLSSAPNWNWLHKQFILSMPTKEPDQQKKYYRSFMAKAENEILLKALSSKKLPSILGNAEFVDLIKKRFFEKKRHIEVPESKQLAPDTDQIKIAVCKYYKIDPTQLYQTKRGTFNEARSMGIYLCRYIRGDTLIQIGEEFKIESYSTVSSVIERFKELIKSDRRLFHKVEHLRKAIIRQKKT
jgi:REP element-mobilizing transposase RayT